MRQLLSPKEIILVCDLFFLYEDPEPLEKNLAIMITDLFFNDDATLGSVGFQTLFDLFMGAENMRKIKPKEKVMVTDLFFNYGPEKVIGTKDAKLIIELFLLDATVITTTAFNTVYDIFLGTD